MSYSGQSNPPWQRNNLSGNAGGQGLQNNQMGIIGNMQYQQNTNSQMYNQNYNNSSQNSVGSTGLANNLNQIAQASQIFNQNAAVAYPQSRGLNPLAFNQTAINQQSQSLLGQHPQQQQQNQQPNKVQSKIGYVTKLHTDCGFVDDEIFFHLKVCKGGATPKLGDRVLVEAAFNPHSPFEWNASRIQIVPTAPNISSSSAQNKQQNQHKSNHQQLQQSARNNPSQLPSLLNMKPAGSGYNAVPPPNEYRGGQRGYSPSSKRSPERRRDSKQRDARERDRISDVIDEIDRKKRREERERSRERRDRNDRDRRDISNEKRDRSPARRASPKRRRGRGNPRYMVEIPKISLNLSQADVLELRRRYENLYIPSDFFFTHIKWSESFPPNNPFSIQRPCAFHIMHKSIELPTTNSINNLGDLEPTDLDYTFSAKVMLMGFPPIAELYHKSLGLNSNHQQEERDDDRDFIHPSRLINFLVGIRGKNETMAIGGPWSPSLDGENPQKDQTVLIKTAIRNCKALTGIDLTGCTQWYRFLELYYHRSESIYKGKTIPGRVETVVIYLPDINSCMPTRMEWTQLQDNYKMKLEQIILNNQANCNSSSSSIVNVGGGVTSSTSSTSKLNAGGAADTESNAAVAAVASEETGTCEDDKLKPTHFSQLDVKTMKLQNLRDELLARNLSTKGLKPQLTARLTKAINVEKASEQEENLAEEDNKPTEDEDELKKDENTKDKIIEDNIDDNDEGTLDFDMADIVVLDEYDGTKNQDEILISEKDQPKVMDEKEIAQLERRYKLPELPQIIVHPSKTAKSGKFDCTIMSLSVLLDYRPEDTKERSFEVSLFAELFNEMLMRDFGFNIYNELITMPDKSKEKDDEKKKNEETITNDDDEKSKDSVNEKTKESNKNGDRAARERRLSENDNKKARDDKTRDKKPSKRLHEDDSDDDALSMRSDRKKKSKLATYVAKRELLLSFVYFDTTHCGFIYEKDLEELFYIIGLNLSRGQIRKLLGKIANKDAVHYRKLTDNVKDDETVSEVLDTKLIDHENSSIAIGNLNLLPIFSDRPEKSNNITPSINNDSNSAMIVHNGCLLDIEKLVLQMKRSEKAREEIEQVLSDLTKQHSDLQNSYLKANNKIKDLQSETKSLSKKLRETEDNLFSTNRKYNDHHSIIQSIYDKISPIFAKSTREKDRSDRSDRKDERDIKTRDDRDKTREIRKDEKEKKTDGGRESKNREDRSKMENKIESKDGDIDVNAVHDIVIKEEKSEKVELDAQNPSNELENIKKE